MSTIAIDDTPRIRRILTPEGVRLPFEVATVGARLLALIIDVLLIHVLVVVLFFAGLNAGLRGAGIGFAFAIVASFLLRNFYFVFMELRWGGATLGKRKLGLRVISRDGGPVTAEAVLARNMTRDFEIFLPLTAMMNPELVMPGAPGWGMLLGLAWMFVFALLPLFNRDRLRCGDIVGGTMVVKAPQPRLLSDLAVQPLPPTAWDTPEQLEKKYDFTPEQLDLYGIHELQVLEDVLRESTGLRNRELVERVCEQIKAKIDWESGRVDPDQFLLAFYKAQRAHLEQKMLFGERREKKK